MKTHTAETLQTMTPSKAVQFLKEGNHRFIQNLKMNRNLLEQVDETKNGQFPFAVILSCMDSKTSAELIFDQGLGDIFSTRVAGNVLTDEIIGSMEYACQYVGSKLILILGHSNCGATTGACKGVQGGNLTSVMKKFEVPIKKIKNDMPNLDHHSSEFIEAVTKENVHYTMDQIFERSSVLKELYLEGRIGIAGAYYHVDSGQVFFLKE